MPACVPVCVPEFFLKKSGHARGHEINFSVKAYPEPFC